VVVTPSGRSSSHADPVRRALAEGRTAKEIAGLLIEGAGFSALRAEARIAGLEFAFAAQDRGGGHWLFDVSGSFGRGKSGLIKSETLWKALGKASALRALQSRGPRLVLLTMHLPAPGTPEHDALVALRGEVVADAFGMLEADTTEGLRAHASA
jgi:site-specific DNA-methyltransferase (adenine-specific)